MILSVHRGVLGASYSKAIFLVAAATSGALVETAITLISIFIPTHRLSQIRLDFHEITANSKKIIIILIKEF